MCKSILVLLLIMNNVALGQKKAKQKDNNSFFESLLMSNSLLKPLLQQKELYKIQIVYTQINRNKKNEPEFKHFQYNVNHEQYFYPASTVKMPTAFLALQKINELGIIGVTKNTSVIADAGLNNNLSVYNDPTTKDGRPTIAQYIKQIFMVSDNDANNHLYDILGQRYINDELSKLGFGEAQILHKLGVSLTDAQNRLTPTIYFTDSLGKKKYEQPPLNSNLNYIKRNDFLGNGYYKNNKLEKQPFDFSTKNRIYIDDLHEILLRVYFPENYAEKKRFNLMEDDYRFIYKYMSQMPTESTFPTYNSTDYYDAYCKFLLYGADREKIPANIRIFNKVGDAYGFLTDVAYIVDFENNIEFAVSATIYVNSDGIFNDDKYEYETIGYPFMKNLGKTIYDYELKREKKHLPNLDKFKIVYDK